MKKLHPTQQKILDFLKKHREEGVTIRELQEILDVSSTSVVHHHLKQLEKKGYIEPHPHQSGDYIVVSDATDGLAYINLYGMAQCGPNGLLLDGQPEDKLPMPGQLLGFPESQAFLVRARGDSMSPRIQDGDLVIAQAGQNVQKGDIIVCSWQEQALIKKIHYQKNQISLLSLNKNYEPIPVHEQEGFRIEGLVRGVISYF